MVRILRANLTKRYFIVTLVTLFLTLAVLYGMTFHLMTTSFHHRHRDNKNYKISPELMNVLMDYGWPDNVRELLPMPNFMPGRTASRAWRKNMNFNSRQIK